MKGTTIKRERKKMDGWRGEQQWAENQLRKGEEVGREEGRMMLMEFTHLDV